MSISAALTILAIAVAVMTMLAVAALVVFFLLVQRLLLFERTLMREIQRISRHVETVATQVEGTSSQIGKTVEQLGTLSRGLYTAFSLWSLWRKGDSRELPWWWKLGSWGWSQWRRRRRNQSLDKKAPSA